MPMTTVFQSLAKAVGAKANAAASETPKAADVINFEPISFPPVLALTPIARGEPTASANANSCRSFDRSPDLVHDLADLTLAHDERRGQFDRVAGRPDHDPRIEERVVERATDTLARAPLNGREIDCAGQAHAADVDDIGQPLEPHDGVIPLGLERLGALEQALVAIEVERRQRRGAGERMPRIG